MEINMAMVFHMGSQFNIQGVYILDSNTNIHNSTLLSGTIPLAFAVTI